MLLIVRSAKLFQLELAQTRAGFVQIVVLFGEAEAEKVFSAAGPEEGCAGN